MDQLKNFDESCITFLIEVGVPGSILGDEIGGYFTSKQLVSANVIEYSKLDIEILVLNTLQQMSRAIANKMVEKLNVKCD